MILQALKGYYDREINRERPAVPPLGYSFEQVEAVLILSRAGEPIELQRIPEGRYAVPQIERTSGIKPKFLWDNTSYVFGVSERSKRSDREHASFREQHLSALESAEDLGLRALFLFMQSWASASFLTLPGAKDAIDTNLVFKIDGDSEFLHQRVAARNLWLSRFRDGWGKEGVCAILGVNAPIAQLHPSVGGVRGAQTSGAYIVSFNADAYESYGLLSGGNAPVSEAVAFEYTASLSSLLAKGSRNKAQIGDATTVFWAEAANAAAADAAEVTFAALLNPPDDAPTEDDAGATARVRTVVKQMAEGRPLEQAAPDLAPDTRFYVLGLSPNAARISVRFWHPTTLGDLGAAFQQHWQDLRIEPVPWKVAPAIWRLLVEVAPQRKSENVPPNLAGEVMRAILGRARYPRTLLTGVIMRIRADGDINGLRAALIKACLIRQKEDVPVALDRDNANPGYRLGRLFAVLESAQKAALPGLNATIRDRYFGAASATPATVFPVLMRNSNHHLANLRKGEKGGLAVWLEREIGEVIGGIEARFPGTLRLEEQGQFAIGYYHQRFAKRADKPAGIADDATDNAE